MRNTAEGCILSEQQAADFSPRLTPSEGKYLTNGETVADGAVYLGKNDTVDNWREITAEEKAVWDSEQKAKSDAEAEAAERDAECN